jgi:hypothetical protein
VGWRGRCDRASVSLLGRTQLPVGPCDMGRNCCGFSRATQEWTVDRRPHRRIGSHTARTRTIMSCFYRSELTWLTCHFQSPCLGRPVDKMLICACNNLKICYLRKFGCLYVHVIGECEITCYTMNYLLTLSPITMVCMVPKLRHDYEIT